MGIHAGRSMRRAIGVWVISESVGLGFGWGI